MDFSEQFFRDQRIDHWDRISEHKRSAKRLSDHYYRLLKRYYQFAVPPGLKVLELGCGQGDLLASLDPTVGVGVDISGEMVGAARKKHPELHFIRGDAHDIAFSENFDVVILSDLVNDLWDVQKVFRNIRRISNHRTRIVLNFFNNMWRIPLTLAKHLRLGGDVLEQNWFAPHDVINLLELTDFQVIKRSPRILFPFHIPYFSELMNKYVAYLPLCNWFAMTNFFVARPFPSEIEAKPEYESLRYKVSVIVPARNEAGNIRPIIEKIPKMGRETEIIFVEGGSTDNTYEVIKEQIEGFSRPCKLFRQEGQGKGDAVRLGFKMAQGDILMIYDADMTVPPADLKRFYDALSSGKGEFINGVRLVYPLENDSMRFLNMVGNKFFSLVFSWLLGQPIKDTLCGTKVLFKSEYDHIAQNRRYFGDFDPFGDFDLLFGAAKNNLKIVEIPIRYRYRTYGETNIHRWQHGWLLLRMVFFAAKRVKFI